MSEASGLPDWRCARCGERHDELPAVTLSAPDAWFHATADERAAEFDLTTDTCIWRPDHFFIRCALRLPLLDREGTFDFGVWSTLSRENFDRYVSLFDSPERASMAHMFGWFSNRLPGYPDTTNLKCRIDPNEAGWRPLIELEPTDHPLALHQRNGILIADAVAYLHDHVGFDR